MTIVRRKGCCPTCGKPWDQSVPRRFCWKCKKQITRHHKWYITDKGRVCHRICERPECYK